MHMELRWLRAFLLVAEEMHFSRAARRLNLAQPALTAQIRQIEAALGARLFERTNRMRGLTAAGRALLPEAQALVARAEGLARKVRQAAQGESGILRLGLIPPAATSTVADALRHLALELPDLEIHVRQDAQQPLETGLLNGDIDLMLGRPPENSRLGHRRLFTEQQGVVLRADDALAQKPVVQLASLHGRRLILLRRNAHFGQNFLELAAKHRVRLDPVSAADDFPSLHWLVRAGLGVAPCSLLLAGTLGSGIVARPLSPALPKLEIHAIWSGDVAPPTATRLLRSLGKASD